MKFVHSDFAVHFEYEQGGCQEWIIENALLFRTILDELQGQASGEEGHFVLSEGDKLIPITRHLDFVTDPYHIDLNSKPILAKVYGYLKEVMISEAMYYRTQELQAVLQHYFYDLEQNVDVNLQIAEEAELGILLKAMDTHLAVLDSTYYSRLSSYLHFMATYLGIRLFVFVNLHDYLEDSEMQELSKECSYKEYNLLLLERRNYSKINGIKRAIVDEDNCELF